MGSHLSGPVGIDDGVTVADLVLYVQSATARHFGCTHRDLDLPVGSSSSTYADDIGMLAVGEDAAEAFYRLTGTAEERRSVTVTSNIHPLRAPSSPTPAAGAAEIPAKPQPQSTGRVWMVAGRNQRPTDLIFAGNRARVFCRLPVLRLVRDFWLGVGVRVAAEGRRGAVTGSGLVRPRLRAARRRRTGSATGVRGASLRAGGV
jgi:hypothetical protein